MNKNLKKGFTLVELLVVIAILAVLAVVTVVGYTSFTKKAKVSNDVSLTTQLNTILQANETTDGANKYPHEAVEELVAGGFDVTKFTPTTEKYNYVYDLSQNRIFLLDESYNVVSPSDATLSTDKVSVFGFAGSQDEVTKFNNAGYSVYLKDGYTSDTAYVSTSVDVGTNNTVKTVNYTNTTAQNALIRTNNSSTIVNIYGPNDVVKHYGEAKEINIAEVAMSSYHENGNILGNINVAKGNVEIEQKATVSNIVITEVAKPKTSASDTTAETKVTPEANSIKVEVKEKAEVASVQSKVETVKPSTIVSGTGASTVTKIEINDQYVAYIGSQGYATFNEALLAANSSKEATIMLTKDATFVDLVKYSHSTTDKNGNTSKHYNSFALTNGNKITIDLNGKTLTYSHSQEQGDNYNLTYTFSIVVKSNTSLTIKNGSFVANEMPYGTTSLFNVQSNSSVYVYGVQVNTSGAALYPQGDAAKVVVDSSTINAGTYAVATNAATVDNYHVNISITNSELSTQGYAKLTDSDNYDGDGATVLINVAGTLNIEDSKIYGHRQALVVRAGTATVKNTTISADLSYNHNTTASTDGNDGCDTNWGSGNNLPTYPVIIGSDSTSYKANAVCTFTNVTVENKTSIASRNNRYIYLANNASYSTTFTYDSTSTGITYEVRSGSTATINGKKESK